MGDEETITVIDNLLSQDGTNALSARQGFVLRQMIEAIQLPEIATDEEIDAIFADTTANT